MFWQNMVPVHVGGGELTDASLSDAIKRDFGSLESFQTTFAAQAAGVQGSGWGCTCK
jgi:superoxide dismutase, Fe-Mn family